jgi:hypothetical protein
MDNGKDFCRFFLFRRRTDLLLPGGYKIIVPVYLGLESDRKWVSLPDGDFIAQIYRLNLNFLFSPTLSWYNFVQYETREKLWDGSQDFNG